MTTSRIAVGIDVGGTFTDLAALHADGTVHTSKVLSVATDRAVGVLEARGLKFDGWATPGATALGSAFDTARVTARRAERRLHALPAHGRTVRPELSQFTNRLADLLWLLARQAEQ